jgi:hypothetical protein
MNDDILSELAEVIESRRGGDPENGSSPRPPTSGFIA